MKRIAKGLSIIATSKYRLNIEDCSNVKGGNRDPFIDNGAPVGGCACCICSPNQSANTGKDWDSSIHG